MSLLPVRRLPPLIRNPLIRRYIGTFYKSFDDRAKARPIIVFLGFYDCDRRQIKLYSELGSTMGYDSIGYVLRPPNLFEFNMKQTLVLAKKIINECKIFGHDRMIIFSLGDNGALVYQELACLEDDGWTFKIQGAIFDSAPRPLSLLVNTNLPIFNRLGTLLVPKKYPLLPTLQYMSYLRQTYGFSLLDCFREGWCHHSAFKRNWKRFYPYRNWPASYMLTEKKPWPLFFIYNPHPFGPSHHFINQLAEKQRQYGRTVVLANFQLEGLMVNRLWLPSDYAMAVEGFCKSLDQ